MAIGKVGRRTSTTVPLQDKPKYLRVTQVRGRVEPYSIFDLPNHYRQSQASLVNSHCVNGQGSKYPIGCTLLTV